MGKKRISIIVPVYNAEEYLASCVDSILAQTYRDIEVILIDDGSTDNSSVICDEYHKKDERVKVLHTANGGVVAARKRAVALATGEYVLGVDADDWIDDVRLQRIAEVIEQTDADMVYSADFVVEQGDRSIARQHDVEDRVYQRDEIEQEIFLRMSDWTKCFAKPKIEWALWLWAIKTEIIKSNMQLLDDKISRGEDMLVVWLSLLSARSVAAVKNCTYHYRQTDGSITHQKIDWDERSRWYQNAKAELTKQNASANIMMGLLVYMHWVYFVNDYEHLNIQELDYLYPYKQVKKHSKIVVYGAGRFGKSLVQHVRSSKTHELAMWIDKCPKESACEDCVIQGVEAIKNAEYDYVIIAALNYDVVEDMERTLLSYGIDEKKIARIEVTSLREDVFYQEV